MLIYNDKVKHAKEMNDKYFERTFLLSLILYILFTCGIKLIGCYIGEKKDDNWKMLFVNTDFPLYSRDWFTN